MWRAGLIFAALGLAGGCAEHRMKVDGPMWMREEGVWRYTITSDLQKGPNDIDVLLPDGFDRSRSYRVLYVLPVETGIGGRFGDGLQEVKRAGLHNKYNLICVQPAFDTVPWYMDHATDPHIRQESYLRDVVVSFVESHYPTPRNPEGRLLLGFSKSGWGALSLVLRNPQVFGAAVSWDAPLMLRDEDWTVYDIPSAAGTRQRFARYRIETLLRSADKSFKQHTRLAVLGQRLFGAEPGGRYSNSPHTVAAHRLMAELGIRHLYNDELPFEHRWDGGWLPAAVAALMELAGRNE